MKKSKTSKRTRPEEREEVKLGNDPPVKQKQQKVDQELNLVKSDQPDELGVKPDFYGNPNFIFQNFVNPLNPTVEILNAKIEKFNLVYEFDENSALIYKKLPGMCSDFFLFELDFSQVFDFSKFFAFSKIFDF